MTRTYAWGIESPDDGQRGLPGGGMGCDHKHRTVVAAAECMAEAERRATGGESGWRIAGAIIHAVEDGRDYRLTDAEAWQVW